MANRRQREKTPGLSIRTVLLHPTAIFLVATGIVIGGAVSLWNYNRNRIIDIADFQLNETSIQLSAPAPAWTHSDLKSMLLNQFQESSILDANLVPDLADFIRSLGWVEKIIQIQKSRSGLSIDLIYRNPVVMVKINDNQLVPVDRLGVILDCDTIDSKENPQWLKVSMFKPIRSETKLHAWTEWPDKRVREAAAIGDVLADHWKLQQLVRIVTFRLPGDRAESQPFELWTQGHVDPYDVEKRPYAAKVIWGSAPGLEQAEEANAVKKIQAIDEFIAQRGPLAESIPRGKSLDVRTGTAILSSQLRTAEQINLIIGLH